VNAAEQLTHVHKLDGLHHTIADVSMSSRWPSKGTVPLLGVACMYSTHCACVDVSHVHHRWAVVFVIEVVGREEEQSDPGYDHRNPNGSSPSSHWTWSAAAAISVGRPRAGAWVVGRMGCMRHMAECVVVGNVRPLLARDSTVRVVKAQRMVRVYSTRGPSVLRRASKTQRWNITGRVRRS